MHNGGKRGSESEVVRSQSHLIALILDYSLLLLINCADTIILDRVCVILPSSPSDSVAISLHSAILAKHIKNQKCLHSYTRASTILHYSSKLPYRLSHYSQGTNQKHEAVFDHCNNAETYIEDAIHSILYCSFTQGEEHYVLSSFFWSPSS